MAKGGSGGGGVAVGRQMGEGGRGGEGEVGLGVRLGLPGGGVLIRLYLNKR